MLRHHHTFTEEEARHEIQRIPFPQSIKKEKFEEISHPAFDMMQFVKDNTKGNSEKEEGENNAKSKSTLMVPQFWNPPSLFKDKDIRVFLGNYGERLITPDEAKVIGSFTKPNELFIQHNQGQLGKNLDEEGDSLFNPLLETIFVSIASYRDYRCPKTVRQLFNQATYPSRMRVGIVDQIKPGTDLNCAKPERPCSENPDDILCKYSHLIDVYEMDASLAVGPVLARHIGNRMYRGEYFVMQSDAHMEFVKGWDVDIIKQWYSANNEMAVLSTYVSSVDDHYNFTTGLNTVSSRPKMCNTDFDIDDSDNRLANLMHGQQPEGNPDVSGTPTLSPFWAAGFSFARGHFLVQVPYDRYLPMVFQGEEINIGLRGFTYGYDFYAPERSVLFHYYSHGGKDKKVKSFYENSGAYKGLEQASMARLLGITELLPTKDYMDEFSKSIDKTEKESNTNDNEGRKSINHATPSLSEADKIVWNAVEERRYGVGKVRSIKKFLRTFGINVVTRKIQHHLCRFVGQPMNGMFLKYLRHDTMGIDYDRLSFEFHDPEEQKKWKERNGDDAGEE